MSLVYAMYESPIGPLQLTLRDGAVTSLGFADEQSSLMARIARRFGQEPLLDASAGRDLSARLDRYFKGDLGAFDGIEVDAGGTAFQARVWTALRSIPSGSLCSYSDIARAIGAPTAVRAVGAANGQNPVGIIVPCHRVIGSGGALTGYTGGLERKRWLIAHERAHAQERPFELRVQ